MSSPTWIPDWPPRSLVAQLPAALRDTFLRMGRIRRYARGQVIIAESASTTDVFIVLSGFVRVLNNSAIGEETMIAIRTRGELIGELAALDGQPRTSSVIAASDTTVRVIDAVRFRAFAAENPVVNDAVARSVVGKLRNATRYRVETGQASVLIRVSRVLDHLVDGYGMVQSHGVLIDVPLTQRDLASLVGTSGKSVFRAYDELRHAGVIAVAYRQVTVLDVDRLRRYAEGLI